jgi:lysozyme family protein
MTSTGTIGIAVDRFAACIAFVLQRETEHNTDGSVKVEHDSSDPGGTTKYGIDQRSHAHVDVAHLSEEQAKTIYRVEKWNKFRCGEMKAPWDLAAFDSSVNPGEGWMPVHLQRAVGVKEDGWIGPKTIDAVNAAPDQKLIEFLRARCAYYRNRPETIDGKPFRDRYLKGWLNRTILLAEATLGADSLDRIMIA